MYTDEPTNEQTADIIAINQLGHTYAQAISRGSISDAVQVYAPDGVLTTPVVPGVVGREAIHAAITEFTKDLEVVFHCVHNSLVHVDGDRANATFQLSEWSKRRSDGTTFLWLGFYDDELVRLPEGWRFAKRTLIPRVMAKADIPINKISPVDALRTSLL